MQRTGGNDTCAVAEVGDDARHAVGGADALLLAVVLPPREEHNGGAQQEEDEGDVEGRHEAEGGGRL